MAKGSGRLVSPAARGRAPRWSEIHSRSYGLSEAQIQAFETEPGPG